MSNLLVLGISISEHKTDGVLRFEYFCRKLGLEFKIVGEGKTWMGGDLSIGPGGGQKINELIETIKILENKLIIVCDTYDLFPLANEMEIINKFNKLYKKNHIIFSSEIFCWPNKTLANKYPIYNSKYKFLNSGCIMGYRDDIYKMIIGDNITNNHDDQLFYTEKLLAGEKIILDHNCEISQTLCGVEEDVILHKNRIFNKFTKSFPCFIHGNGPSKNLLNYFENYIEINLFNNFDFVQINKKNQEPRIFIALYVDTSDYASYTMFMTNFQNIKYNNKIVYIYDKFSQKDCLPQYIYKSNIQSYVFSDFKNVECEYYLILEQKCIITNPNMLREIIPFCRDYHRIISPMLLGNPEKYYTNFWGSINDNGYYQRSNNYFALVDRDLIGLWNVPYVTGVILLHKSIISEWNLLDLQKKNEYDISVFDSNLDDDMNLCSFFRKNTLFMYMINISEYGYFIR